MFADMAKTLGAPAATVKTGSKAAPADTFVTILPHLTIQSREKVEAAIKSFWAKMSTESEPKCLFYGFTISEDGSKLHCREAYDDAEAALFHLKHIDEELKVLTADGCAKLDSF
jgi:hypothetical protein